MADEIADPSKANDHPEDFAVIATKMLKTDPDAATPPAKVEKEPAPAKVEKTDTKSKVPEGIFEPVKVEKKAEEKKLEDKKSEEELALDKIKDPALREEKKGQFSEMRRKNDELEKKAADLESKIAEYEAKGKDTEALSVKLAEMEKKHAEAMDLVRKVNIELDPEFRRQFVEGRNKLMGQAKTIVEESGGNAQDIETALNLSGKARVDALRVVAESLDAFQSGRLGRVIDALTELDATAAAKRSNPEEYLTQRQAEEQTRAQRESEERAKIANTAFESAMSRAASESELFRVTSDTGWNEQGQTIKQQATEFWRNNRDPEKAARVMIDGFSAPVFRQLFLDQRKEAAETKAENENLKKELASLYGRGPRVGGGATVKTGGFRDFADTASGLMNGTIQQ